MSDKNDKPDFASLLPASPPGDDESVTDAPPDGPVDEPLDDPLGLDDEEPAVLMVPTEIAEAMYRFYRLLQTPSPRGELARGVMRVVSCMQQKDFEGMSAAMREFETLVSEFRQINEHEDERSEAQRLAGEEGLPMPLLMRVESAEA